MAVVSDPISDFLTRFKNATMAQKEEFSAPYSKVKEEIARIPAEAMTRWQLTGLTAIHRHGRIAPGEEIVLVVTTASHRKVAFESASFLDIDSEQKREVPEVAFT